MKKILALLLLLSIVEARPSVESNVLNHYTLKDEQIRINWTIENLNETDKLRFYLLDCEVSDAGIKCDSIKADKRVYELEVSDSYGERDISVNTKFGLYRLCVNLLHGGQDCDRDNYFLVQESVEITNTVEKEIIVEKEVIEYVTPAPSFILEVIKFPEKFEAGKNITTIVNLTNPTNSTQKAKVYSYLFRNSKPYTGAWTSNAKEVELSDFSSATLLLNNIVVKDAYGNMSFRIRAKVDDKNYDVTILVFVSEYLFSEVSAQSSVGSSALNLSIKNSGNIPANITMKLYGKNSTYSQLYLPENSSQILNIPTEDILLLELFEGESLIYSEQISQKFTKRAKINTQNILYTIISLSSLIALYVIMRDYG